MGLVEEPPHPPGRPSSIQDQATTGSRWCEGMRWSSAVGGMEGVLWSLLASEDLTVFPFNPFTTAIIGIPVPLSTP